MPALVRDLGPLTPTSSGATFSNAIGNLDDASSITIFFTSSAAGSSTASVIQVSQFNPGQLFPEGLGIVQSSQFYNISSSAPIASSGPFAISLTNVSFRGFRLSVITSFTSGEVIAFVSKQISV
jgi:hypothetical protein